MGWPVMVVLVRATGCTSTFGGSAANAPLLTNVTATTERRIFMSHPLDRQRHALAHADAQRRQRPLAAGLLQLMQRRQCQPRAAHAQRLPQRKRPPDRDLD